MKFRARKFGFLAVLLAWPCIAGAAPAKSTNQPPQVVQSVFIIPNSPKEGRDPFFPDATSLYQTQSSQPVVQQRAGADSLKLVGILGSSFANINGVTFAIGETQEVKTAAGPVSVRLLEIKPQEETVVIEANGLRRQLKSGGGGGLTGRP